MFTDIFIQFWEIGSLYPNLLNFLLFVVTLFLKRLILSSLLDRAFSGTILKDFHHELPLEYSFGLLTGYDIGFSPFLNKRLNQILRKKNYSPEKWSIAISISSRWNEKILQNFQVY